MAGDKYNLKNPAVKRILQEVKEMQSNPSDDFMSLPLEENIFEWNFAIRGPQDTEFEGGIYHGRIQLPAEYPFKPPSFMLLTPNGRFETQTKICLSISNHHPEHWQPSWSVRTALVALIAFMPTSPNGALGSLDYKKEERRALAVKSRESSPKVSTPDRQKLIDEIHEYMMSKAPPIPLPIQPECSEEQSSKSEGDNATASASNSEPAHAAPELRESPVEDQVAEERQEVVAAAANPGPVSTVGSPEALPGNNAVLQRQERRPRRATEDRLFTWAAVGLTLAIMALLLKKFMKASGPGSLFMDGS